MMWLKKFRTREGFSLLEIIMAVGLLSLVSVYTLQIYITAQRLNQQTIDMDESIQIANNVIQLTDGSSWDEMRSNPVFYMAQLEVKEESVEIQQWYNEKWLPVDKTQSDEEQTIFYTMVISIEPHQLDELRQVNVRINRIKPYLLGQEDLNELYHLTVLRYIPDWEVVSQ